MKEQVTLQTRYRTWEISLLVLAVSFVMVLKKGWPEPLVALSVAGIYLIVGALFLNKLVLYEEYVLLKFPLAPFRNQKIPLQGIYQAERKAVLLAEGCQDYHITMKDGKVFKFSTLFMRNFAPFQELFERQSEDDPDQS